MTEEEIIALAERAAEIRQAEGVSTLEAIGLAYDEKDES